MRCGAGKQCDSEPFPTGRRQTIVFLCQQSHKLEYGIRHANKEVQTSLQSNSTTALLSKADGDWRAQFDFFYIAKTAVPYLCQLVFAAILWVKLVEMFVTLMSLIYALSVGQ